MQVNGRMLTIVHDLKERLLSPVSIISWLVGASVCSIVGPFNTYEVDTFAFRAVFWPSILFVSMVLGNVTLIVLLHRFPSWSIQKLLVISCGLFATLYWAFVWVAINIIYGPIDLPHPAVLFAVIASVSVAVYAIIYFVSPDQLRPAPTPELESRPVQTNPTLNPFMQRLGPDAGERLIRLAMRDHYIEAYTERGQRMLHMRFADAVRELGEFNGDQIHRSHWINFDEVEQVVKQGPKTGFKMSDGFIAPIARSRKPELKERGLL